MNATVNVRPPQRLLIRGVNWLGDAVMTLPALARLREALPQTHIALLTQRKLQDLWIGHAAVDEVIVFDPRESVWQVARRLKAARFDTALILPNSPRSALETWLARIPRRIGYAARGRRWFLTDPLPPRPGAVEMRKRTLPEVRRLTQVSSSGQQRAPSGPEALGAEAHQLHQYLHLAARLGASRTPLAPRLTVQAEEVAAVREKFLLSRETRWLGLNPAAAYGPAKRWPAANFAAVAREILKWPGWGVVLFGTADDWEIEQGIELSVRRPDSNICCLAGHTTLRELCAALACCEALLTNDSGPMHLAAALDVPVVACFGSTSPELTGPGLPGDPGHRVLRVPPPCAPCFLRECPVDFRCLRDLTVESALKALREVLAFPPP